MRTRIYSLLHTILFWGVALFLGLLVVSFATGCSTLKPDYSYAQWEHISHPAVGPPFGPRSEEDSLDHTEGCGGYHVGSRGFVEVCTGYRLRDGGFYGPDWTGGIKAGIKIHGDR